MEERKMLLRKCISEVIVDREKKVVRFYVNRVPGVDIGAIEAPQGAEGVTLRSARSRT
jgi:hypothetical protein